MCRQPTDPQSKEVPQTTDDLARHLSEQFEFLKRSAESFDDGFEAEAKRIAVTLRVLLHDTGQSHSLLGQTNRKGIFFCDTAIPETPGSLMTHCALAMQSADERGGRYVAFLDGGPAPLRKIAFDDWWNAPVFRNNLGETITRKHLVLSVADQDGGAHVDLKLNKAYAELSRGNSMGWQSVSKGNVTTVKAPEAASLRQIAHEVLKTFIPGYKKTMPGQRAGIVFGGATLTTG